MSHPQDPWPPEYPLEPEAPNAPSQQPNQQQPYPQPPYPQPPYPQPPHPQLQPQPYHPPPSEPYWPVPPAPEPPKRSRLPLFLGLAAGVVALVVVISAIFIVRSTSAAADVRLEAIKTPTDNPFMDNVGTDELAAAESPAPTGATGTFAADTPGLYGGTMNNSSCDRDKMLRFLMDNPDKGRAWAEVVGVSFAELDRYFAELTPVVLRVDTAVSNHGFANGKATKLQSVLQAGTAVLVDRHGTPVAKCYCGNPLTPPAAYAKANYTGRPWRQFSTERVVVVQATTVVINSFTLVDVRANKAFERPRATTGSRDAPRTSTPTPFPTTAAPTSKAPPGSGYTADDAARLVEERTRMCAQVDWGQGTVVDVKTRPGSVPGVFIVEVTHDNSNVYAFSVDVASKKMTPANQLAAEAAQACPAFRN